MRKLLLLIALLCGLQKAFAQNILDDSTKNIWGPKTTLYRLEKDIFLNRDTLYRIDTNHINFYNYDDFTYRDFNVKKDLGNLASPQQNLFFSLPTQIGIQYGIDVLNYLAFTPAKVRYFNNQSPYLYAFYLQGGKGRNMLQTGFARNVGNRLNFGGNMQRITTQKQIGATTSEDREADHISFNLHGSYVSKDARLQVYANYGFMHHRINETGGIRPLSLDSLSDGRLNKSNLFDYEQEAVRLSSTARSHEYLNTAHLYTQYALLPNRNFQVFYVFDRKRQKESFVDFNIAAGSLYKDTTLFNNLTDLPTRKDTFYNETKYLLLQHQAGIKGQLAGHLDYAAWVKYRNFGLVSYYGYNNNKVNNEFYLGGMLNVLLNENYNLNNEAQYIPGRDYQLKSELVVKPFVIGGEVLRYAPTLIQNDFRANFLAWQNNFNFTTAQRLYGNVKLKLGSQLLTAGTEVINLKNYIYYNSRAVPEQTPDNIQVFSANANVVLKAGKFYFDNFVRYQTVAGPDVIRMPKLFVWEKIYFAGKVFKNSLNFQAGFDIKWNSDYYGDAYMPLTKQFYIQPVYPTTLSVQEQKQFLLNSYIRVDPFVSMRIKRTRLFLKMVNVNMGLGGAGYFATPYWPGTARIFEFGVYWHFFD